MNLVLSTFVKSMIPIALFGVMGVWARYCMSVFLAKVLPPSFPYPTFFINILGSFLIGIVYVLGVEKLHLSPMLRLGMMVGFLGGFTTFSSFSLDAMLLLEKGKITPAFFYLVLSPVVSIVCTYFGIILSRKLF